MRADPASITTIELALDTANAARIAPMWAALLTGSTDARGRGTIGDDVRDHEGPGAGLHGPRRPGRHQGVRVYLSAVGMT